MKKRKKGEKENPTQGYDNEKKAQTYAADTAALLETKKKLYMEKLND